jgi:hypothetical protein
VEDLTMRRLAWIVPAAIAVAFIVLSAYLLGLFGGREETYEPVIDPAEFTSIINNTYLPYAPGTIFTYDGVSEDGPERNIVVVTSQTKIIMDVTCAVVWDRVWLSGSLVEETYDWYAQDIEGNVWYFGEDSKELENGAVVSTEGSWEAGVDGAKPGIVMQAHPAVGNEYRQEYYKGEAEDMAKVLALNVSVTVPFGSYTDCLQTNEWTPLEKGYAEDKYYAPGVGLVSELVVEGGTGYMELVDLQVS